MSPERIRIKLLKNSSTPGEPRLFLLPSTLEELYEEGGKKLGISGVKVAYSSSGAVIDDLSLLREDEEVYLSTSEGFYKSERKQTKLFRIAVLGPGGVGKSRLTIRYVRRTFVESYDPTIEDAFRHQTWLIISQQFLKSWTQQDKRSFDVWHNNGSRIETGSY